MAIVKLNKHSEWCTLWSRVISFLRQEKSLWTNLFQINIIRQFHVLGVNLENLQSASSVRDANVHFPIKTPWKWWGFKNTCWSVSLEIIKDTYQTHLKIVYGHSLQGMIASSLMVQQQM